MSSNFQPLAIPGTLHNYAQRLVAFEYALESASSSPPDRASHNYVFFLAGLFDTLLTTAYPPVLHRYLQHATPGWSLVEVQLSSAGTGWQTTSLANDAAELAQAVAYFRKQSPQGRIVLLGHSTGCQVATRYVVGPHQPVDATESDAETLQRPHVDGVILQAGISDREGILDPASGIDQDAVQKAMATARELVAAGKGDQRVSTAPQPLENASAYRLLSLVSDRRHEADDDYFSSDLDAAHVARVWGAAGFGGRAGLRLLVLLSGADEHMPAAVDKEALSSTWAAAVQAAGQGVWDVEGSRPIAQATHSLRGNDSSVVEELCGRIAGFLQRLSAVDKK